MIAPAIPPWQAEDAVDAQIALWQRDGLSPEMAWQALGQRRPRWAVAWYEVRQVMLRWLLQHYESEIQLQRRAA